MTDDFDWSAYLGAMSALHGLRLDSARRAAVVIELRRIHEIARPLLEFPLAPDVEPAPVFRA